MSAKQNIEYEDTSVAYNFEEQKTTLRANLKRTEGRDITRSLFSMPGIINRGIMWSIYLEKREGGASK